jgi:hypothetical protein
MYFNVNDFLFAIFSSARFSRYCGHICITYTILTEIIIMFNWFGVTAGVYLCILVKITSP